MADLDAEFRTTEKVVEDADKALKTRLERQKADDRSHIAKLIAWAFVGFVAATLIAVAAGTAWLGWDKIAEPTKILMAILGSVMLPVVTLVIGHYFGKER